MNGERGQYRQRERYDSINAVAWLLVYGIFAAELWYIFRRLS